MGMKERVMPRDVATRWNSTFNMLDFAVDHKVAVNKMTSNVENDLRAYEMNSKEWGLANELREVLKVSSKTGGATLVPC
jgi:protein associated with RNAse G/E